EADPSLMIGQIQLCPDSRAEAERVLSRLEADRDALTQAVRAAIPQMESRGGGLRRIEYRKLDDPAGGPPLGIIHLVIDVLDAMGANIVNHAAESVAPEVHKCCGLEPNLRILSNLASHRLARAKVSIPLDAIGGQKVGTRIAEADRFARIDPYR